MDDTSWIADLTHHWPTLAWLTPVILVAYYVIKFLSLAYDPVNKLMGGVGRHWRASAERKQRLAAGEVGLLRDEVKSLSAKVDELQRRDAIYWEYVMYDQEWHREMQSKAIDNGWDFKRHLSFLEFRAKWWRENHAHEEFTQEGSPF